MSWNSWSKWHFINGRIKILTNGLCYFASALIPLVQLWGKGITLHYKSYPAKERGMEGRNKRWSCGSFFEWIGLVWILWLMIIAHDYIAVPVQEMMKIWWCFMSLPRRRSSSIIKTEHSHSKHSHELNLQHITSHHISIMQHTHVKCTIITYAVYHPLI